MQDVNQRVNQFFLANPIASIALLIWILAWKGTALWKAARSKHLTWFVLLLIINSMGLFEISYIFFLHRWDLGGDKLLETIKKKLKGA